MTVVLDDHLIRDWMTRRDDSLVEAVQGEQIATTNLWTVRLCKSAASASGGALLQGWSEVERRILIKNLVALPDEVTVLPMRDLAWRMGELMASHTGLSALGAEAVAAAVELNGRLLVSARDDGPGIRRCCTVLDVDYRALPR